MKLYTLDNQFIEKTNVPPRNFTGIIEHSSRLKVWYLEGKLHRLDGPAIEWPSGGKEWYVGGKLHKLDGPAVEYPSGRKEWYINGKQHRIGGPAIEWQVRYTSYYIEGIERTKEEHDLLYKIMKLKGLL